jgi:hypothetical protein
MVVAETVLTLLLLLEAVQQIWVLVVQEQPPDIAKVTQVVLAVLE